MNKYTYPCTESAEAWETMNREGVPSVVHLCEQVSSVFLMLLYQRRGRGGVLTSQPLVQMIAADIKTEAAAS